MPSSIQGFTGSEILQFIQDYIGNQSAAFVRFMTNAIPLAEFRFCKLHDWSFLTQKNLSLTVASGTDSYALSVATIGYYIAASDVMSVFSAAGNVKLQKTTLEHIRSIDPDQNDGSTAAYPTFWAPAGDNTIVIWPKTFNGTTLKIDGKVTPTALLTLSNYPTIPYRYQETFIEYLKAIALDRENDSRANTKKQEVMGMIKTDVQADMAVLGDTDLPRVKSSLELAGENATNNLDQLYNYFAFYSE